MRIGFIGAGGTGKTTTAKLLSEKTGIPFFESISRQVLLERGITEEAQRNYTTAERYELQNTMFHRKLEQDNNLNYGITDRTLLDHYLYLVYRCYDSLSIELVEYYNNQVYRNLRYRYDIIVYCPLYNWKIEDDGIRENIYGYRYIYDLMVQGYLKKFGHPRSLLIMKDSTVSERIDVITNYLKFY